MLVGDLNKPLIHIGEIHAHIVQHEANLAAVDQLQDVGALQVNIIHAVKKAGDDDLAAGVFVMAKHLVDQDPRIGRLQHRDRGHNPFQPARSADHAGLPQGRQLQQVGYSHAHAFTFFSG